MLPASWPAARGSGAADLPPLTHTHFAAPDRGSAAAGKRWKRARHSSAKVTMLTGPCAWPSRRHVAQGTAPRRKAPPSGKVSRAHQASASVNASRRRFRRAGQLTATRSRPKPDLASLKVASNQGRWAYQAVAAPGRGRLVARYQGAAGAGRRRRRRRRARARPSRQPHTTVTSRGWAQPEHVVHAWWQGRRRPSPARRAPAGAARPAGVSGCGRRPPAARAPSAPGGAPRWSALARARRVCLGAGLLADCRGSASGA